MKKSNFSFVQPDEMLTMNSLESKANDGLKLQIQAADKAKQWDCVDDYQVDSHEKLL